MSNNGKVNIYGKEYLTVALRVQNFRQERADWTIATEIVTANEELVIMKASIIDAEGRTRGTGHAEEYRKSSQINRTSALENCETSAIGRALAACGYAGSEYASANEVQNAIHQQQTGQKTGQISGETLDMARISKAAKFIKDTIDADITEEDRTAKLKDAHSRLSNDEKMELLPLLNDTIPDGKRKYRNIFNDYVKQ